MKRSVRFFILSLATAAAGLTLAGPARANVVDLTCTPPSSEVNMFDPPLTNQPAPTIITSNRHYGPCVSLSHPDIVSGTSSSTSKPFTTSCIALFNANSFTKTITWNTGERSTLSGNYTSDVVGATVLVISTGTVTDGLFAGQSFIETKESPSTQITMCTLGLAEVSSVYGELTLEIYAL